MTAVWFGRGGVVRVLSPDEQAAATARYHAAREEFGAEVAARERERRAPKPPAPAPMVLIPTQRQRAAGRATVEATAEQMPAACKRLVTVARSHGWMVHVTYAHALMPPKRGGEGWWDNHTVALRARRTADGIAAWGVWSNGKWDAGQVRRAGMVAQLGAREFAALLAEPVLDSRQLANIGSTT